MTKFEVLTRGYFDASVEIFLKWRNDENKQMTLETLATETLQFTGRLVTKKPMR